MAKYRVVQKSIINNMPIEPGAVIDHDGEASENLEPFDADAYLREMVSAAGGDPAIVQADAGAVVLARVHPPWADVAPFFHIAAADMIRASD